MVALIKSMSSFFGDPAKVFWSCCCCAFLFLVVDGSLIQLWGMRRDEARMNERIAKYRKDIRKLQTHIELASKPQYMEESVRDRFDMVGPDEIVFVFPNE